MLNFNFYTYMDMDMNKIAKDYIKEQFIKSQTGEILPNSENWFVLEKEIEGTDMVMFYITFGHDNYPTHCTYFKDNKFYYKFAHGFVELEDLSTKFIDHLK